MIAEAGQTFYDLVIQETGSIENAFAMSLATGIGQTDDLNIGDNVVVAGKIAPAVTALFNLTKPANATANNSVRRVIPTVGIGTATLEQDFIIPHP